MSKQKDTRLRRAIVETKEHHHLNYDEDEDDPYTDDDAIEDLMAECGKHGGGFCSLAGTEYCDWECPFNE